MNSAFSPLLVLKSLLLVGLIGLGLFFISTLEGLPGILLGFTFLYLAFFSSVAFPIRVAPRSRFSLR